MLEIIEKIKSTSSTKEKAKILTENKDNEYLKKVLKYAYDTVTYTYGVSYWNASQFSSNDKSSKGMFEVLDALSKREITGHKALKECRDIMNTMDDENNAIFKGILERDFKLGVSSKTLNKIWKGMIPTPNYCRCSTFKRGANVSYPAIIQLKCDGTYREAHVVNGKCLFRTRSGEEYSIPNLEKEMTNLPDGYYTGEFTIGRADEPDADRQVGNGLINSKNPPFEKIHFTVWDYLTDDEYTSKTCRTYAERFKQLSDIVTTHAPKNVEIVPSMTVENELDALKQTSVWMSAGLEGGVLKDPSMKFKNGTSNAQFKIKLKVDVEMRCKGFQLGTNGTKYENKNKVILFENDEGTVKGQCSGMSDAMIEEVTKYPNKYIGKVVSVQFNDLTKASGSDTYSLSHPRFAEWRNDKNETDTLEKCKELINMAKSLN